MQRHRDLAGAEVGPEVPPDFSHGVDDVLSHLLGYLLKLVIGQAVEVLGLIDALQEVSHQ